MNIDRYEPFDTSSLTPHPLAERQNKVTLDDLAELPGSRSRSEAEKDLPPLENGADLVYLDGTRIGTAVEVRDVDVLVRERMAYLEVESIEAVTRGYVGWGTAIAAVLGFLLVHLLQDV